MKIHLEIQKLNVEDIITASPMGENLEEVQISAKETNSKLSGSTVFD